MISWCKRAAANARSATSVAGAAVLLVACGGGGSDGPVSSTADFPLASAMSAYAQSAHQFNLAGALDGTNFTMGYSYTPGAPSTFEGKAASTANETIILRANSTIAGQTTIKSYFAPSPFVSYGSIDQDDGTYTVVNQLANFPATAKVGQLGQMGNETEYANSSKSQVLSTSTLTWSLDPDTATTAQFCINIQTSGGTPATGSQCYRVDAAGTVTGLVVKVTVNGKTLTLS